MLKQSSYHIVITMLQVKQNTVHCKFPNAPPPPPPGGIIQELNVQDYHYHTIILHSIILGSLHHFFPICNRVHP